MSNFDIVKEYEAQETFRVKSLMSKFDLQTNLIKEQFTGKIDLPKTWNIGLIVGRSGTGKTTIAKEIFKQEYIKSMDYKDCSIIDAMPKNKTINEITEIFNRTGFSSPPSWLKPYHVLSNGEKMRVDIARTILEDRNMIVFDEFTSVVDREVAKITSYALQKCIRKQETKFVAVSCHYDIIDWLLPDWIFNTDTMTFIEGTKKKDQKLSLKYTAQNIRTSGECLLNITI